VLSLQKFSSCLESNDSGLSSISMMCNALHIDMGSQFGYGNAHTVNYRK
jgi:hypothetical protein